MPDNTLITDDVIAKLFLMHLRNNTVFGPLINRKLYTEIVDAKIGSSIRVKLPIQYLLGINEDITAQINTIKESSTTFTVDKWYNVPFNFTSKELMMDVKDFDRTYVEPAAIALGNQFDFDIAGLYKDISNYYGTAGTVPNTFTYLQYVQQYLTDMATPRSNRSLVCDPETYWTLIEAFHDYFNQPVGGKALQQGILLPIAGLKLFEDQNVRTHTPAGAQATVTMAATLTKDSTLNQITLSGVDYNIAKGDIISIADVNAVKTISTRDGVADNTKESLRYTKKFVAAAAATKATTTTVNISPTIVMSDDDSGRGPAYQNVDAYPVSGAAVTINGGLATAFSNNLAFHRDALAAVCVPVMVPDDLKGSVVRDPQSGFAVTVCHGSDILTRKTIWRLDCFYGVKVLRDEWAVRLIG